MASSSYFVTLQPSGAVSHVLGPLRFSSQDCADIIVCFCTRLEIFRIQGDSLELSSFAVFPVHGRVLVLQEVRLPGVGTDRLLLLTEKGEYAVLGYDADGGRCATLAAGRVGEAERQLVDGPAVSAVHPGGHLVALAAFEFVLNVVAVAQPASADATAELRARWNSAPLGGVKVLDLAFVLDPMKAHEEVLAALVADDRGAPRLLLWTVQRLTLECSLSLSFDLGCGRQGLSVSHRMLPTGTPAGLLVLGAPVPSYWDGRAVHSVPAAAGPADVVAAAVVSEASGTWLVSCASGALWSVEVDSRAASKRGSGPPAVRCRCLGAAAPARAMACWRGNMALLGSSGGDSAVLRLLPGENQESGALASLEVLATWPSLGPAVDFCAADLDGCGLPSDLLLCSGEAGQGYLRALRPGLGVEPLASASGFDGALGLWAVPRGAAGDVDTALFVSFASCTRCFCLGGGELRELPAPGLRLGAATLLAAAAAAGALLQVHAGGVEVVEAQSMCRLCSWSCPGDASVQAAAASQEGLALALAGGEVLLLRGGGGAAALEVAARWRLGGEVAALCAAGDLFAAGLWSSVLCTWRPDGAILAEEPLPGGAVARSVSCAELGGRPRLLAALSDGSVAVADLQGGTGRLSVSRHIQLGTYCSRVLVCGASEQDGRQALALGRRPCLLSAGAGGRLGAQPLALRHISHAAMLHVLEGSLVLACIASGRLVVGVLEQTERLHHHAVPLGLSPQCLCWHPQARLAVVGCQGQTPESPGCLRCFRGPELVEVGAVTLEPRELVTSAAIVDLGGEWPYIAVGTGVLQAGEVEASRGRVLIYEASADEGEGPLVPLAQLQVSGAVYHLAPLRGLLLGAVNSGLQLWRLAGAAGGAHLQAVAAHRGTQVAALHLQVLEDRVLVADMVRSALLLRFDASRGAFEELAADESIAWVSAMQMLDTSGRCICIDDACNAFSVLPCSGEAQGTAVQQLWRAGYMHIGEFVNRMHCIPPGDSQALDGAAPGWRVAWASVDGALGLILPVADQAAAARYLNVQRLVERATRGTTILPHKQWRDVEEFKGHNAFIDGDVLRRFSLLPPQEQNAILAAARGLGLHVEGGVDGLLQELRSLGRLF